MSTSNTIKRLVKARALRQGLLGGHPVWRAVWVSQFLYKQFSKVSKGGEAPISFDEPLKEGEVWAVVHEPEKSKKGRGEGRRLIIGPKRQKPRANSLTGLALAVAGEKILAAPSPERINQILGDDVFEPAKPTRKQKKAAKKLFKAEKRASAKAAKQASKDASAAAKARKAADRRAVKVAQSQRRAAQAAASEAARAADKAQRAARKAAAKAERGARKAAKASGDLDAD